MESYNAPVPERMWGGRPWITTCGGGCCLGFIIVLIGFIFLFRWLYAEAELPTLNEIQAFLSV